MHGACRSIQKLRLAQALLQITHARPHLRDQLAQVFRRDSQLDRPVLNLLGSRQTDSFFRQLAFMRLLIFCNERHVSRVWLPLSPRNP